MKCDKCPCSKVHLIIAQLCSTYICSKKIDFCNTQSFHACKSVPKIRGYHCTICAVMKQECAVTKCKLCSITCKVTGKSCHDKHNTHICTHMLITQHLGNRYKSKKARNCFAVTYTVD